MICIRHGEHGNSAVQLKRSKKNFKMFMHLKFSYDSWCFEENKHPVLDDHKFSWIRKVPEIIVTTLDIYHYNIALKRQDLNILTIIACSMFLQLIWIKTIPDFSFSQTQGWIIFYLLRSFEIFCTANVGLNSKENLEKEFQLKVSDVKLLMTWIFSAAGLEFYWIDIKYQDAAGWKKRVQFFVSFSGNTFSLFSFLWLEWQFLIFFLFYCSTLSFYLQFEGGKRISIRSCARKEMKKIVFEWWKVKKYFSSNNFLDLLFVDNNEN